MDDIQFLTVDGRRIAYRFLPGDGPMIVFLPGYRSDMSGIKAGAFRRWAEEQGRACLLFDPSGCGQSEGEFADGTLSRWRDEVLAVIDAVGDGGPVLPIGSSMGGWLMLLVAERLGDRLHGLMASPPRQTSATGGARTSTRPSWRRGRSCTISAPTARCRSFPDSGRTGRPIAA